MSQAHDQRRQMTEEEKARLRTLRDRLWSDFDDDDKTCLQEGGRLTSDDWSWVKGLLATTVLRAEVAQGLTTPNPFVLCLEVPTERGLEQVLMIHPTQLPEAKKMEEALEIFRAVEFRAARLPSA